MSWTLKSAQNLVPNWVGEAERVTYYFTVQSPIGQDWTANQFIQAHIQKLQEEGLILLQVELYEGFSMTMETDYMAVFIAGRPISGISAVPAAAVAVILPGLTKLAWLGIVSLVLLIVLQWVTNIGIGKIEQVIKALPDDAIKPIAWAFPLWGIAAALAGAGVLVLALKRK